MREQREYDPKIEAEQKINDAYNSCSSWLDSIETHLDENGNLPELPKHKQEKVNSALEQLQIDLPKFFANYDKFPDFAENDMYKAWVENLEKRAAALKIEYHREKDSEEAEMMPE